MVMLMVVLMLMLRPGAVKQTRVGTAAPAMAAMTAMPVVPSRVPTVSSV